MIDDGNVEQVSGVDEPLRQRDVRRARLRVSGRMVVEDQHRRRIDERGLAEDRAGMRGADVQCADGDDRRP